jgi:Zn-dependent peptidase ImmA (M78 family)/transcriptional regulator with XRE-family HTH domain
VTAAIEKDPFNPEMLALARARQRLTQSQLGDRVNLKQAVVSKIEMGVRAPTGEEVQVLAKALGVPESFFFRPAHDRFVATPPLYRLQRKRVSKVGLDQLNADFVTRAMHLREMLRSVEMETGLPLPQFSDDLAPEQAAEEVRRLWLVRPGPIQNLTALIEAAGVFVIEIDASIDEFEGAAFRAPNLPTVIFVRRGQTTDRRRFTLAHELGHLVLHHAPSDIAEKEANVFAHCLLMPEKNARVLLGPRPRLDVLRRNRLVWKVSIQAQVMIADRLGMLSPASKSRLFQQIGMLGWRTAEPDPLPPENSGLFQTVLRTMTEDLEYTAIELARLLRELPEAIERLYGLRPKSRVSPLRMV